VQPPGDTHGASEALVAIHGVWHQAVLCRAMRGGLLRHWIDIPKNSCGLIFDRFQPSHFLHSKINHYKTKDVSEFRLLNSFKPVHSQFKKLLP
jgi:hypothetical protein